MTQIVPAIMPSSFEEMKAKMENLKSDTNLVQLDVMDGYFAPESSWPYVEGGAEKLDNIAKEESSFPYWKEIGIEADLMISSPEMTVNLWLRTEVQNIVLHIGATDQLNWTLENIHNKLGEKNELSVGTVNIGLAATPDVPNDEIIKWMDSIDFVQLMGIDKIGFQGQPFNEDVLDKIKDLKDKYPEKEISVDGGIDLETAPKAIEAGADRLVIGSAIFNTEEEPKERLKEFQKL